MLQIVSLSPGEVEWLSNHLGHEVHIDRDYYRNHEGVVEISKVCRMLMAVDCGKTATCAGKNLKDLVVEESYLESTDQHTEAGTSHTVDMNHGDEEDDDGDEHDDDDDDVEWDDCAEETAVHMNRGDDDGDDDDEHDGDDDDDDDDVESEECAEDTGPAYRSQKPPPALWLLHMQRKRKQTKTQSDDEDYQPDYEVSATEETVSQVRQRQRAGRRKKWSEEELKILRKTFSTFR